ncbi:MAG: FHA domain-containing protein [Myxococcaceae bacterium]
MLTCPSCGVSNPPGSPTCAGCGGSLAPAPAARPRVLLRVVRADGGPESVLPMRGEVMTAGTAADLQLPDDPFMAPVQVRFFFSGGRLAVEDAGGGNGVFARLRAERELPVGGELRLGRQRLLLEVVPPATPAPDGTLAWGSPDPGYRLRIIQLLEGGLRGAAFPLREGDNLLGRETGDIVFPTDGFVSGRHAVLKARGERLVVRDVGSSNGTFLRLTNAVFVDSGDQFLVGRELLRVELQPA